MLTKIAANSSHSTADSLLNFISIFELTNHECRYFRQAVERCASPFHLLTVGQNAVNLTDENCTSIRE
jgi:hypothetical protein